MTILVTGAAGFIGSALTNRLLLNGEWVVGLDNHNDYYDPALKDDRLLMNQDHSKYQHFRLDLSDGIIIKKLVEEIKPRYVVHLAAQAGVRYSIQNPDAYIASNINGFFNILEASKNCSVEHFVYASSSSVYGANTKMPYSAVDPVNHPLSLYAASKKSNELMAHSYSHLYRLPTTGFRFFTVYGPWGRPDMAPFKFVKAILNGEKFEVYNFGKHKRDFTYIDDVVDALIKAVYEPASSNKNWDSDKPDPSSSAAPWRIYNLGNSKPVDLMDFIRELEKVIGKKADIEFLPLQNGDVPDTHSDTAPLMEEFDFLAKTSFQEGVRSLVKWYMDYYK